MKGTASLQGKLSMAACSEMLAAHCLCLITVLDFSEALPLPLRSKRAVNDIDHFD
jgi:hypothetical protein